MKNALLVTALLVLLGGVLWPRMDASRFGYDEADYMTAARHGIWSNLWDSPSLSFPDFVALGLSSVRGESRNLDLSETIRSMDDVPFHRHSSGPLYFFWLKALQSMTGSSEFQARALNRLLTLLNLLVIYFGCRWAMPGPSGAYAGAVAGILFATSYTSIVLNELGPHPLYITFYLATLFALTRAIREKQRRCWLLALFLGALAFNTLMIGFLVVVSLLAAGWWNRRSWNLSLRQALRDSLYFCVPFVLTWPAAILKLSLVRTYAILAYLALFRKNVWGDLTLGEAWKKRLLESPLDWLFLAVAGISLFLLRKQRRDLWPWAVYILAALALTGRIPAYGPRYMTPVVPAIFALIALLAGDWLTSLTRRTATILLCTLAAVCLALLTRLPSQYPVQPAREDPFVASMQAFPRRPGLRVLAPQANVPTLHFYFPELRLTPYEGPPPGSQEAVSRGIEATILPDGSVSAVPAP